MRRLHDSEQPCSSAARRRKSPGVQYGTAWSRARPIFCSIVMRVLLVGDDPADAKAVHDALDGARHRPYVVECAPRLVDALERLRGNDIAAVLLDLSLPDSHGIATFEQVLLAAPHIPILIIGSPDDHDVATQAVRRGAQDYLHKTRLDTYSLKRALRYAIERKVVGEALFVEQQRAEITLNSIGDAVLSVDRSGKVIYLNPAAEQMTGWLQEEARGRPLVEVFRIIDATTREPARNPMEAAAQIEGIVSLTPNCLLVRRDGSEMAIEDSAAPIRDRDGDAIGAVMVFHDVSAARELALQAIHLSQHDPLTDLPNRVLLNDRLTQAIALARRHAQHLAVLFLDLDQFKHVNDDLGHVVGDGLLQSVAGRLVTCVRGSDTVSRQGGDEFVVLLPEIEHADDAIVSAQRIIAALAAPHEIDHHLLHASATIGISIYPDDGADGETLIKSAD